MSIEFLRYVLEDFPDEKIDLPIAEAKTPLYWMKHIAGTASSWMKGLNRPFQHRMRVIDKNSFFEKLEKQFIEFKEILKDNKEITWQSVTKSNEYTIPWIMIRSANHAMHHASMLIIYRHYYGLPALKQTKEVNWGNIVDLPGNINYSN